MQYFDRTAGSFFEDRPLGRDPVAEGNRVGDGMARNSNDRRQWRKQEVAVGTAASRMRVLLKARSIRWVPQPVLVSEEKATVTPSGFPHQHRRFLNTGIGAAQAPEGAAGAVLAKAQQQRRQPDGQVFCTRRAGIHHRLCRRQCLR